VYPPVASLAVPYLVLLVCRAAIKEVWDDPCD